MKTIYDLARPGWSDGYIIAIGLTASCLIATPTIAQHMPDAYRHDRGPYDSERSSPYSNHSQRREREVRRHAKAVARDRDDSFFHFKPVKREDHDDDDD